MQSAEKKQQQPQTEPCTPFCEICWGRGFATPSRVVVGEGEDRQALCIQHHGDYERAQEEARELREREQAG